MRCFQITKVREVRQRQQLYFTPQIMQSFASGKVMKGSGGFRGGATRAVTPIATL